MTRWKIYLRYCKLLYIFKITDSKYWVPFIYSKTIKTIRKNTLTLKSCTVVKNKLQTKNILNVAQFCIAMSESAQVTLVTRRTQRKQDHKYQVNDHWPVSVLESWNRADNVFTRAGLYFPPISKTELLASATQVAKLMICFYPRNKHSCETHWLLHTSHLIVRALTIL